MAIAGLQIIPKDGTLRLCLTKRPIQYAMDLLPPRIPRFFISKRSGVAREPRGRFDARSLFSPFHRVGGLEEPLEKSSHLAS